MSITERLQARTAPEGWATNLSEGFKATVMPLDSLHAAASGIASVAIHLKGNMLRDRPLLEGANEQLTELVDSPFSRW